MHKNLLITVSANALLATLGIANAATTTTTFAVNATVQSNCLVSASGALNFAAYTPGSGDVDAATSLSVRCTKNTPYTVGLNAGGTTGSTVAQRLLANGADTLEYNLYTDAGRTTVWGNTAGSWVAGTGNGFAAAAAQTLTVYGRLPDSTINQDAATGAYADTITVTVTY